MLPNNLPNDGTVHYSFRTWTNDGTFARITTDVRRMLRARYGHDPDSSLAIVDRQSVKTTAVGGDVGDDAGKQISGTALLNLYV